MPHDDPFPFRVRFIQVCDSVQSVCEAEDAVWDIGRLEACSPCPCEEEVLDVVLEALGVIMCCSEALRGSGEPRNRLFESRNSLEDNEESWCSSSSSANGSSGGVGSVLPCSSRREFRELVLSKYSRFLEAVARLTAAMDAEKAAWPHSLKFAAIRAMSVQLPARVYACVCGLLKMMDEGIVTAPVAGPQRPLQ